MLTISSIALPEDNVVVCGVDGGIIKCNETFLRLTRQRPEDLDGLSIFELLSPESNEPLKKHFDDLSKKNTSQVNGLLVKMQNRAGQFFSFECILKAETAQAGVVEKVYCFFRHQPANFPWDEAPLNENKYRLLIESVNDIIYSCDPNGLIQYLNPQGFDFIGYTEDELTNLHVSELIDPKYKVEVMAFYQRQLLDRKVNSYLEFPIISKSGTRMWVGQRLQLLQDLQNGGVKGALGVLRDITEKRIMEQQLLLTNKVLEKRVSWRTSELEKINLKLRREINLRTKTEEALMQSESEFRDLFQSAHDAIVIFDLLTQRILGVNVQACELYKYEEVDFLKLELAHLSSGEEALSFANSFKSKKSLNLETVHFSKTGERIVVEIHATRVKYKGNDAVMTINRDITRRKEMEEELSVERVRRLTALIDGQEMERKRLSSELHDGPGQLLTASLIYLKKLDSLTTDQKAKDLVLKTKEILESTVDEVRSISHNLMPAVLSDFGLVTALNNMVNSVNRDQNKRVKFVKRGNINRLNADIEVGLYRIAQEALNNSLKYAQANNIVLTLSVNSKGELKLTIKDDGIGIDSYSATQKGSGNGIYNMHQRASVINSQLTIKSALGKGTTVVVLHNLDK